MGGLGNQMFQYAFARSFALQHNTEFRLNLKWFYKAWRDKALRRKTDSAQFSHAGYQLNVFNIAYKHSIVRDLLSKKKRKGLTKITEDAIAQGGQYNPKFMEYGDANIQFSGYFCSEKYFQNCADIIRSDFTPKVKLSENYYKYLDKIKSTETSVSLHIRRGDYVTHAACKQIYYSCDVTYYESALNYIKERNPNVELFVFSNDIPWVKEHIKLDAKMTYIDYTTEKNAYEDMLLMSNCQHNIIANSTFSWWGGWLNANPKKIVISPKIWFKKPEMQVLHNDLLPESWIAM